ncbi:MAG: Holliday junction resolvase Hjc [Nanoarchaeota archaeon]
MGVKNKGTNAERELLHMFWNRNWACLRSAGSGSMKYPGPDLLAGSKDNNRKLAIECKTTNKGKIYLSNYDIDKLKEFSNIFDARAWFAVKFQKKDWRFLSFEDLKKKKNSYIIDSKVVDLNGISFEELISYKVER